MIEGLILVAAIASLCALLIYIAFNLNKEKHFFLQLILLVVVIVIAATQLPRAALDYGQECENMLANQTVTGNVTIYEYEYLCTTRSDAPLTLFRAGFWLVRVVAIYLFLWMLYTFIKPIREWIERKTGK